MKEIQDAIDKLGVSRPIFRVLTDSSGEELELNLLSHAAYIAPNSVTTNDVIEKITLERYAEVFNKVTLKFEKRITVKNVIDEVVFRLRKAYVNNSPNKKPKSTGAYEWLFKAASKPATHPYLVALYRYVHINADHEYRFDSINNEHAKNFISILNRIKEKYE